MKLPSIDVNPDVAGPAGQQRADLEDFVPGWRQVDSAIRQGGDAAQSVYQGGEAAALARQRATLEDGKIGEAIQGLTDPLEKRWKQTDLSNQQVVASQQQLYFTRLAQDRIKNGDVNDGNLTQGFLDDFDKQTGDLVNSAATPEGKFYLTHSLAEMRSHFGTQVMLGQSERAGLKIKSDAKELVNNYSETARLNSAMTPGLLKKHEEAMLNTVKMLGGDSRIAQEMISEGGKAIAVSSIEGDILRNPQMVKAQLALPIADRDPVFQAMAPYIGGETANVLAKNADARIKNLQAEKDHANAQAKIQEGINRGVRAGEISNAISAGKNSLPDGTRIIDAIAALKVSPQGFHLGAQVENEFKASSLGGVVIAGDAKTEARIISEATEGQWTRTQLSHLIGYMNKDGTPGGLSVSAYTLAAAEADRHARPESQMDQEIKKAAIAAANTKFAEAEKIFGALDTSGHVASQKLKYLIDFDRAFETRRQNGERAMDILDAKKPGSLANFHQPYIPNLKSVRAAAAYAKAHPTVSAADAAAAMGREDAESYPNIAVKPDPAAPTVGLFQDEKQEFNPLGVLGALPRRAVSSASNLISRIRDTLSDDEYEKVETLLRGGAKPMASPKSSSRERSHGR